MKLQFENTELEVRETRDHRQWYLTIEEVAKGCGVSRTTISNHLTNHADELRRGIEIDGVDITDSIGRRQESTVIYREGVIKLGFFIRSKKAALFRQWATNLIVQHLDQTSTDIQTVLSRMDKFETEIKDICRGLRDEVDELRTMVGMLMSDDDATTMRSLIRRVKDETGVDGRAIVGHMRKVLNVGSIYTTGSYRPVINLLKNMLGEGLQLIKKENTNVISV